MDSEYVKMQYYGITELINCKPLPLPAIWCPVCSHCFFVQHCLAHVAQEAKRQRCNHFFEGVIGWTVRWEGKRKGNNGGKWTASVDPGYGWVGVVYCKIVPQCLLLGEKQERPSFLRRNRDLLYWGLITGRSWLSGDIRKWKAVWKDESTRENAV